MKKTLMLDEATWRCGKESDYQNNKRGSGSTELENNKGFMCCLGQFSNQLKEDLYIKNKMFPSSTNRHIPFLTRKIGGYYIDTKLSDKAIGINDDENTTVFEKVRKLRSLFATKGIKIVFKRMKNANKGNTK